MTEPVPPVHHICILGGGSSGWMAAAAIANAAPDCAITVVESEDIGTIGVGEATIPPIKQFNAALRIPEADFLRATKGTIKLAIEFVGWGRSDSRYPHPFGTYGSDFDVVSLPQYWLRERLNGREERPLHDWSMAWAMARAARFLPAMDDPRRIQSTHDHAYHFDAGLYGRMLRQWSEGRGVARVEGRVARVDRDGESGDVRTLHLADGRSVTADFFVDCSGFRSMLLGEALDTGFESWAHWLPCDRAIAMPSERTDPLLPYTRATAGSAGWQWRIPLQHRTGNGHVYCSAMMSDDQAEMALRASLDGDALADGRIIRFEAGRRDMAWRHNVVAIGLSGGFLEPLESTSIHLVHSGLSRLLALFPRQRGNDAARAEYNRLTREEYERIRDFIILHYHANQRDEPFWRQQAAIAIPDSLRWRIDNWVAHGRVVSEGPELFRNHAWMSVLVGQGIMPRSYDAIADLRSGVDAPRFLAMVRSAIEDVVAATPPHADYLTATG